MLTARSAQLAGPVVVLVVALAGACTQGGSAPSASPTPAGSPSPTPTTAVGLRVAVVLPPPGVAGDAERARLRGALDRRALTPPGPTPTAPPATPGTPPATPGTPPATPGTPPATPGTPPATPEPSPDVPSLGDVRVVAPDDADFVAATAELLAADHDLVCVLGAGAAGVVTRVAEAFPQTRFCAAPARIETPPDNVLAFDLRVEQATYLAGVAAASVSQRQPGMVVSGDVYAPGRRRAGFERGVRRIDPARAVRTEMVDGEEAVRRVVGRQLADGVRAILDGTATADAVVLEAVRSAADGAGQPPVMIGGTAALRQPPTAGGEVSGRVLMTVTVRLEEAVRRAVAALAGSWEATTVELGLAEEALRVVPGVSERAREIAGRVRRVRGRIVSGRLTVLPGSSG